MGFVWWYCVALQIMAFGVMAFTVGLEKNFKVFWQWLLSILLHLPIFGRIMGWW